MAHMKNIVAVSVVVGALAAGCNKENKSTVGGSGSSQPASPTAPSPGSGASPGSATVATPPAPAAPLDPAAASKIATASNEFGFDLWAKLGTGSNQTVSPASISLALTMTWGGAKAATAAQLAKALHLTEATEPTLAAWGGLARSLLSSDAKMKLTIANRLFGDKSYTFEKPFLDATAKHFDAALEPVDFRSNAEPARAHINSWIESKTNQLIKELLPPGAVMPDTRLVLVNAIYFLAKWQQEFEGDNTRDAEFNTSKKTKVKVPTMNQTAYHRSAKIDGGRVLELPYQGGNTAMWIVLPDAVDGLAAVEQKLSAAALASWGSKLEAKNTAVALPRFELKPAESLNLGKLLQELGVVDAFNGSLADFTGIANPASPADRLYISGVFHKAYVKVNEQGTEAAAATAVSMARAGGVPEQPMAFTVDRPFAFFIVDKTSGLVLFMGRVVDPTK